MQDLIEDLKSELSGDLEELILALFKSTDYYDAWCLNKAMRVCKLDTDISFWLSSFQAEILWFHQYSLDTNFMDFVVELIIEIKCLLKCKILSFATNLHILQTDIHWICKNWWPRILLKCTTVVFFKFCLRPYISLVSSTLKFMYIW